MSGVVHRMGILKELAQALARTSDADLQIKLAVEAATDLVARCSHAGFTVNEKDGPLTRASSDDIVQRANELQRVLGEGPCLDVVRDQDTMVSCDLAVERRWPAWAPRVAEELKVGSLISVLVYTDAHSYGAMSLYSRQGDRFDADDVAIAQTLAGQVATLISSGREIDQLGRAVLSRNIIGQAQGILMERYNIDAAQAFDYLRRISSHSNRKVVDLAAEIATTHQVPEG